MSQRARIEIDDGIAWITLDDGKVNALSTGLIGEIGEALDAAERAKAVTVLRGREGIFSAGFDLPTFKRGRDATVAMLRAGAQLIQRLLAFPHPVLTVCTGHAYPMGAFLLLSADVRLGLAGPWRIGLNEVAIGLTLPRFALELARHRLAAPGFARITTAPMFAPEEALRLGYLDRVLGADELDAAVREETARLRALDLPSFAATKARINERALHAIRAALDEELPAASPPVSRAPSSGGGSGATSMITVPALDSAEARAFAEKWLPAWTGNDPERLLSFYADDAYYSDPGVPLGIRGRGPLLEYFRKLLARNPSWIWTHRGSIPLADGFLNQWHASMPVGAAVVEVDGVCTVQLRAGVIRRNEVFFDRSTLLEAVRATQR